MPVYSVRHSTVYTYEEPVSVCHNLAYLLPRSSPRHAWMLNELHILPNPPVLRERRDYFGNRPVFFALHEPHKRLEITLSGMVDVEAAADPMGYVRTPWEEVRDKLRQDSTREHLAAYQFAFDSPFVRAHPDVHAYAANSFSPGRGLVAAALDLNHRIHRDFAYDPKATTIRTTSVELLRQRRGVCQDFAHLMVGCLRSMGLSGRYVSGYLLTNPPPGQPRTVGSDASHAWAGFYLPGSGWIDLDPTNDVVVSDQHITLAWGRDFGDVSPLRGVILGGRNHTVEVSVDVRPN